MHPPFWLGWGAPRAGMVAFLFLNQEWGYIAKGKDVIWEVDICLRELSNEIPEFQTFCHEQLDIDFAVLTVNVSGKGKCAGSVGVQHYKMVKYRIPCPEHK